MAGKLTEFLTNLSTDSQLCDEFKANPERTMRAHGVKEEHIKLVVNRNYDEVRKILGPDYEVASNHILKAVKK